MALTMAATTAQRRAAAHAAGAAAPAARLATSPQLVAGARGPATVRQVADVWLGGALLSEVNALLGIASPRPDLRTLTALAEAVHRVLGYDTTPKQRWAATGRRADPPGTDPAAFWEARLRLGTGGTCYATVGALHAWLAAVGFTARVTGWDPVGRRSGAGFQHAANVVTLDGCDWLLESSSAVPTPLAIPTEGAATGSGLALVTRLRGVVRFHVARAAAAGTKTYELVADDVSAGGLLATYRDAVRTRPADQHRLVWARSRRDGLCASIFAGTYLLRRGHQVLAEAPLDAAGTVGVLAAAGYRAEWLAELEALGAFG